MPYEYRKLTPPEQQAVVEARKQRGYPLHSPPHPFRTSCTYLLTAAIFEHAPIMAMPERRTQLQGLLLTELQEAGAEVIGWVILPNHYHVLITVGSLETASGVLKHVHGVTSREWNIQDGQVGRRRVWYHFADRAMRNERQLGQALNYIHLNPVKHQHVDDPYAWEWSSLCMYMSDFGGDWVREQWRQCPPQADYGAGWDDD